MDDTNVILHMDRRFIISKVTWYHILVVSHESRITARSGSALGHITEPISLPARALGVFQSLALVTQSPISNMTVKHRAAEWQFSLLANRAKSTVGTSPVIIFDGFRYVRNEFKTFQSEDLKRNSINEQFCLDLTVPSVNNVSLVID
ncbi:hypothetical protein J6590_083564 [Homalodisca vitripennis]|nr:hypothetical protein J6590_101572 [Homalodisca vitripennis]KAG8261013.1 hypothetical protein J6590_083564 [Homalodisca vitripennis]